MAQILVRQLDPSTVNKLKVLARRNGRSLEKQVRMLLDAAVGVDSRTAADDHRASSNESPRERAVEKSPPSKLPDAMCTFSSALPLPNMNDVAAFAELYAEQWGIELTSEEALDTCTRLVHLAYLSQYTEEAQDPDDHGPVLSGTMRPDPEHSR